MLDYKSSKKRYLLVAAATCISIICPLSYYKINENIIKNPISTSMPAKLIVENGKKFNFIYFQSNGHIYTCPISRCNHKQWQFDAKKIFNIKIDSFNNIVEIENNGEYITNVEIINKNKFKWSAFFLLFLTAGLLFIKKAVQTENTSLKQE